MFANPITFIQYSSEGPYWISKLIDNSMERYPMSIHRHRLISLQLKGGDPYTPTLEQYMESFGTSLFEKKLSTDLLTIAKSVYNGINFIIS